MARYRRQATRPAGPGISSRGKLIQRLRRVEPRQRMVQTLGDLRGLLEAGIAEDVIHRPSHTDFATCLATIRQIQHNGRRLEADGCYWLWHVHAAADLRGWLNAHFAGRPFLKRYLAGRGYEKLRAAADSMIAWAFDAVSAAKIDAVLLAGREPGEVFDAASNYAMPARKKPNDEARRTDEPFIATPLQAAILKALDGRALKKQPLADEVCKGEGTTLYRPGGLKELRERKKVDHKSRVGFYRPDAPPPDPTKRSNPQLSPK